MLAQGKDDHTVGRISDLSEQRSRSAASVSRIHPEEDSIVIHHENAH
jgi:hypothetical protein